MGINSTANAAGVARDRLARMLAPAAIAVVGASSRSETIGGRVFANLAARYQGPLYPVHPSAAEICGFRAFGDVRDLPPGVDLVVALLSADQVPDLVTESARRGVAGVVVISSGFAEVGADGLRLQAAVKEIARETGIRILGPNCIGFLNTRAGIAANFAPMPAGELVPGSAAIVSQSGGVGSFALMRARDAGLSVDWFVSTGNEVDIDVIQVIDYLIDQPGINVISVFTESISDYDGFAATAQRAAAAGRPVVLLTGGRTDASARAVFSHTGSVVGHADLTEAVGRQYGITVVRSLEELVDVSLMLQAGRRSKGPRVGILVTSGGAGILVADACGAAGLEVPELSPGDQARLRRHMPTPFYGSTANPVDTTAQIEGLFVSRSSVGLFCGV